MKKTVCVGCGRPAQAFFTSTKIFIMVVVPCNTLRRLKGELKKEKNLLENLIQIRMELHTQGNKQG